MRIIKIITILVGLVLFPSSGLCQSYSDYLILGDISSYKLDVPQKVVGGFIGGPRMFDGSGVLAPSDHFHIDHSDKTYEVYYEGGTNLNSPTVQVSQHTGGDSDRWLLHELDKGFRTYYGIPGDEYATTVIDGNTILAVGVGGWAYRWLSSNKVINIEYTDLQMTKPEPLEIVKAYLAKHPSTLSPITSNDLRTVENKTKWIKDEMERRLWLCDKWNLQFHAGKVTQADLLYNLVKSMKVFLNYRQKYFSVTATDDITTLSGYLENNDAASIQSKLSSYKTWWQANKGKAISL